MSNFAQFLESGKLQGKSSYLLRKEFASSLRKKLWGQHLWSPSYCAVSSGGAPLDVVRQYFAKQREPIPDKFVACDSARRLACVDSMRCAHCAHFVRAAYSARYVRRTYSMVWCVGLD